MRQGAQHIAVQAPDLLFHRLQPLAAKRQQLRPALVLPQQVFQRQLARFQARDDLLELRHGIRKNGCVPFEFNCIGVDDGIAMGHSGMLYSLPSRELIANSIETVMNAHALDALVCMPNCDKIVPDMVIGALRVNVPTVFVSGGPMKKGYTKKGEPIDLATAFEAVGKFETKEISAEELKEIECAACPSGGSCSGMFTANSMNTLCEAMGIALKGNGTVPALTPEREELIREARRRICQIALDEKYKIRNIVNEKSIQNALVVDMAMGGSWGRGS